MCINCRVQRQLSEFGLKKAVKTLCGVIGMVAVDECRVYDFYPKPRDKYGSSAFQFIVDDRSHIEPESETVIAIQALASSHISVHYMGKVCFIDIFSCQPFNEGLALKQCRELFKIEEVYDQYVIDRSVRLCQ